MTNYMQKKRKDHQFIKQAYYPGGNTAFREFVAEHLVYPEEALKNNIEGVVQLKIDIDHKGKVTGVKLMQGIGHGCDEEAKRIIKLAKYQVPDNPRKMRVIFHKNIRIQFKKPPVKEVPEEKVPEPQEKKSIQIEYRISAGKKKSPIKKEKKQKSSYSYTIKFN